MEGLRVLGLGLRSFIGWSGGPLVTILFRGLFRVVVAGGGAVLQGAC